MSYLNNANPISGTTMFDGKMAMKGYELNKMCYSLNEELARNAFQQDEMAYCDQFGLTETQKEAIRDRDVLKLLEEGGNIYYLAKFVGMLGLNMQDIGALQTGVTVEEFQQKLVAAGE
ncbi:protocatechuate 4,5-dioxygenase subunit alpha [Photobacterium sp. GJ3]|uniref:protocatechuate 4,5-dioxygenase subunit alpha n=1 Tax=Photobacterium sp. GJ3 TaxID=2829502 RepID=UPI001B8D8B2A|nr:protocatechuate 4,5-dioxygenase subunit alpha [Photobacterium sp. GJ3]QUJ66461.1 protocatechuate 4,5-dioxygenase subunit alpha [Photobacterium sp. GJ3]